MALTVIIIFSIGSITSYYVIRFSSNEPDASTLQMRKVVAMPSMACRRVFVRKSYTAMKTWFVESVLLVFTATKFFSFERKLSKATLEFHLLLPALK